MYYISAWDLEQIIIGGRPLYDRTDRYDGLCGWWLWWRERKARWEYLRALKDWRQITGRQYDWPDAGNRGWLGHNQPDQGPPTPGRRARVSRP